MGKFKKIILGLALTLVLVPVFAIALITTSSAYAQTPNTPEICNGIEATGGSCGGGDEVNNVVKNIINLFSWVVGVVAVIMVIYGGFLYVTSGGSPEKSVKGRNTILYALVGLVIVAFAQIIVNFVLSKVTTSTS